MYFNTIFFIDSFLKKQTVPNIFMNMFALLSDTLKKQNIPIYFLTESLEIQKKYSTLSALYMENQQTRELFLQNYAPNETLLISDDASFLSLGKTLGYACAGFSHTKEFLPAPYCFEDFSSLTESYLEYVFCRCQVLPVTIATTRSLLIREFSMDDMPQLFALYQNESNLQYVYQREYDYDLLCDKFSSYIKNIYPFYDYGLWAVTLKETGEVIGEFGLQCNQIDKITEIELGYILHPDYQGKGYAGQAIRAIFRYARDVLFFDRIVAVIHPKNQASIQVALKCGMHYEKDILFHNEIFQLYAISVQSDRFFQQKSISHLQAKQQAYNQYQKHPDNSVYGKRYQ